MKPPTCHHHDRRSVLQLGLGLTAAAGVGVTLNGASASPAAAQPVTGPAGSLPAPNPAFTPPVDVVRWYENGSPRFRIPALTKAPNGDLLAFYDRRPTQDDLPNNIAIVMRRSRDEGVTWGALQVIRAEAAPRGFGDPSVLVDRQTGRIFCFYAAGVNNGFMAGTPGVDHDDPDVLHADYSFSDDNGATWQHRRITEQIKDPVWGGMFASSGEGIQLRQGRYAGRLIQQYAVRHQNQNWALAAYSDDHGETWQHGPLIGPGADENKSVELSDGRVMLNSRRSGARSVAISEDGGVTYPALVPDPQQVDPGCNGAILRLYPEAAPGDPRAKILVLLNDEDRDFRANLTAKVSWDDGAHWPGRVVIDPEATGYSTGTPLGGGKVGVLYEREGYSTISYLTLDVNKVPALIAPIDVPDGVVVVTAGGSTPVEFTVSNRERGALRKGRLTVSGPPHWGESSVETPVTGPGRSQRLTVPVVAPQGTAGPVALRVTFTAGSRSRSANHSTAVFSATVNRRPGDADHAALRVKSVMEGVFPDTGESAKPGLVGDLAAPWVRVYNIGNVPLTQLKVSSTTGEPGGTADRLEPGASVRFVARPAVGRTLTEEDVAAGFWSPTLTASAQSSAGPAEATFTMTPLDLTDRGSVPPVG